MKDENPEPDDSGEPSSLDSSFIPHPSSFPLSGRVVVLGVSGSISAYKAADLCSKLVQAGATVYPVLTEGARRFVAPATFWGLAGKPVATGAFDEPFGASEIAHLRYAEIADIFVVAPASADFLARLAAGLCDDMLTSALVSNVRKPVLLAPAMNTDMWANPATEANRLTLEARGYRFIEPGVGRLAEGVVGAGRLAEPAVILEAVRGVLEQTRDLAGVRVLITAGPTREALDPVRFLSNRSSGKMGYALAQAAAERGAHVTLVSGPVALAPPLGVEVARVTSAREMLQACEAAAPVSDVVVAAAAVADYAPAEIATQKMKKTGDVPFLTLTLVPTPDILRRLGDTKRAGQLLIGFAAETENLIENAQGKLAAKNLDLVVANDVTQAGAGFDGDTNIVTLLSRNAAPITLPQLSKRAVADTIWDWVKAERANVGAPR